MDSGAEGESEVGDEGNDKGERGSERWTSEGSKRRGSKRQGLTESGERGYRGLHCVGVNLHLYPRSIGSQYS